MRLIPLTNSNLHALVDDAQFYIQDLGSLLQYNWFLDEYTGYATTRMKHNRCMRLHHMLFGPAGKGLEWDHINRNRLDCRQQNLRESTHYQHSWNKPKNKNNTSGFKGVWWSNCAGLWASAIRANDVRLFLGYFFTPVEAALAYDKAARELHGEFAFQNIKRFPR